MATEPGRRDVAGSSEPQFHPELRRAAFFIPRFSIGPKAMKLLRAMRERRARKPVPAPPVLADVAVRDEYVARPDGTSLRVRLYIPVEAHGPRPALLWMHGGGFLIGYPEFDQAQSIALCRQLGIVVAAVAYRLGPEHPYPAPLDDCHAALGWLHDRSEALGLDPARIAVGGASAGGNLAAALSALAHDRGELRVAFQMLIYPNLDDRTVLRTDIDERRLRIWSPGSNREMWRTYLGREPGEADVPAYAAPSRRTDLSGLPPAWIGVGSHDLFLDENSAYAARLHLAGVACALKVVEGAFHAFDLVAPKAGVVADFRQSYFDALRDALYAGDARPATAKGALAA